MCFFLWLSDVSVLCCHIMLCNKTPQKSQWHSAVRVYGSCIWNQLQVGKATAVLGCRGWAHPYIWGWAGWLLIEDWGYGFTCLSSSRKLAQAHSRVSGRCARGHVKGSWGGTGTPLLLAYSSGQSKSHGQVPNQSGRALQSYKWRHVDKEL